MNAIKKWLSPESGPILQFIKYGIAGGAATATNILVFFLCGWFLLPCLKQTDPLVKLFGLTAPLISESTRVWNAGICNTLGFVISNVFCYLLNRLFVFKPGRHSWPVEFLMFFAGSSLAFAIGLGLQTVLIRSFGTQTTYAYGANILAALLINYGTRKFIIFKG